MMSIYVYEHDAKVVLKNITAKNQAKFIKWY